MSVSRFNLGEVYWSLKLTQRQFKRINRCLNGRRQPLSDEQVNNLMEGYRFVDELIRCDSDPLAMGNSSLLLDINTLVVCGSDSKKRQDFTAFIEQTSSHFYSDQNGGVGALNEWYQMHLSDTVWDCAAGLYIQILSQPQLFIEGNHRTATLCVSFLLGRAGYPPLVLTPANAPELFEYSKHIENLRKNSLGMAVKFSRLRNRLATTLRTHSDKRHSRLHFATPA